MTIAKTASPFTTMARVTRATRRRCLLSPTAPPPKHNVTIPTDNLTHTVRIFKTTEPDWNKRPNSSVDMRNYMTFYGVTLHGGPHGGVEGFEMVDPPASSTRRIEVRAAVSSRCACSVVLSWRRDARARRRPAPTEHASRRGTHARERN